MIIEIKALLNTLQQIEIKSTKDNLDKMLGCIVTLEKIEQELLNEQNNEKLKPETYGGNVNG